nr:SirB2 family protein [uncultured Roseateles sp.]
MYSYDQQMTEIHALLAWAFVALFLIRGVALQLGVSWVADMLVLVFGALVLLIITGLSLWMLRYYNPLNDSWLLAKLLAFAAYGFVAHRAMGQGELRLPEYLAALVLLAYVVGVSYTRSAALGLLG